MSEVASETAKMFYPFLVGLAGVPDLSSCRQSIVQKRVALESMEAKNRKLKAKVLRVVVGARVELLHR